MGKRAEFRRKHEQQKRNTTLLVITGFGLIFLAAILFLALPGLVPDTALNTDDLSTVPVAVNYPAPALALESIQGKNETLVDFRDKVLLVNNWATWCPPCKAEMPTLVAFYNAHARDGLMIVAIEAGEPREQVQKFANQYQMPFHVWLDPNGKSMEAFKNGSLPNSYVIDRTGTVRLTWTGQINSAMLEKYVTPLLAGN